MARYTTHQLIQLAADRIDPEEMTLGELRDVALDVFTIAGELRDALGLELEDQDDFVYEWTDE